MPQFCGCVHACTWEDFCTVPHQCQCIAGSTGLDGPPLPHPMYQVCQEARELEVDIRLVCWKLFALFGPIELGEN